MSGNCKSGIYVWKLNGVPKYVGQGVNVHQRMKAKHYKCIALLDAIKAYGEDAFEKEVVRYCEPDELTKWETYYIKKLKTHVSKGGYNISWGGETPMLGRRHSENSKRKMSQAKLMRPDFEKYVERLGKLNEGRKRKNAGSKFIGVCLTYKNNKRNKYWMARVCEQGKDKRLGYFKKEKDAAQAYNNYVISNGLNKPLNQIQ